ncbi:MAG: SMI1/KNR4 family protein [Bacillus sp. (in: Bacteria)]|nr:SMI1/KNR4 family protein [Bacillus sp. (in: firmicutes)]
MSGKLEWKFVKNPATDRVLQEIEREFQITLPEAYGDLMKQYNGARPKPNQFHRKDGEENVVKSFLSVHPVKGGVRDVNYWLVDKLPRRVFPFANDPFGNYICFDYRKGNYFEPTVVLWDHEKKELKKISDSFAGFLDLLCS